MTHNPRVFLRSALLCLMLPFAGCLSPDRFYNTTEKPGPSFQEMRDSIVRGKTTKEGLIRALGYPDFNTTRSDGVKVWTYEYAIHDINRLKFAFASSLPIVASPSKLFGTGDYVRAVKKEVLRVYVKEGILDDYEHFLLLTNAGGTRKVDLLAEKSGKPGSLTQPDPDLAEKAILTPKSCRIAEDPLGRAMSMDLGAAYGLSAYQMVSMSFDLAQLPANIVVQQATLHMYATNKFCLSRGAPLPKQEPMVFRTSSLQDQHVDEGSGAAIASSTCKWRLAPVSAVGYTVLGVVSVGGTGFREPFTLTSPGWDCWEVTELFKGRRGADIILSVRLAVETVRKGVGAHSSDPFAAGYPVKASYCVPGSNIAAAGDKVPYVTVTYTEVKE